MKKLLISFAAAATLFTAGPNHVFACCGGCTEKPALDPAKLETIAESLRQKIENVGVAEALKGGEEEKPTTEVDFNKLVEEVLTRMIISEDMMGRGESRISEAFGKNVDGTHESIIRGLNKCIDVAKIQKMKKPSEEQDEDKKDGDKTRTQDKKVDETDKKTDDKNTNKGGNPADKPYDPDTTRKALLDKLREAQANEKWGKLPECIKQATKAGDEGVKTILKYDDHKERVENPDID